MKIKTDFVTNSSSVNYMICGLAENTYDNNNVILKQICEKNDVDFNDFVKNENDEMYELFEKLGIDCERLDEGDLIVYGLYAGTLIKQNIPLSEIKKFVQTILKEKANVDVPIEKIDLHTGSYFNG